MAAPVPSARGASWVERGVSPRGVAATATAAADERSGFQETGITVSDARPGLGTTRPHILIVTDDTDLAAFLGEGLLYAGFWTSTVASALQTLEVFRLRSFDLALVDAGLAGLGGLELVRRLRGRSGRAAPGGGGTPARTDVPLLLITGAPGEVAAAEAAAAGVDGLLDPPLDLEELAPRLFGLVAAWRASHPDRPWADAAANTKDAS